MTATASGSKLGKSRRKPSLRVVRPRLKLWLEAGGESVMCRGMAEILRAVDRVHSIKAAAAEIGRSYRFVWARIKSAEAALGAKLVAAQIGGKGAERSELTPLAAGLLREYDELRQEVNRLVDDVYAKRIDAVLKTHRL